MGLSSIGSVMSSFQKYMLSQSFNQKINKIGWKK